MRQNAVLLAVAAQVFALTVWAPAEAQKLKITYPTENSTVPGSVIELRGVGADPNGTIEVAVLTNRWYIQDGEPRISPNGSWTYGPCHLEGTGKFISHTIRVTVIKDRTRGESASVRGVVRR